MEMMKTQTDYLYRYHLLDFFFFFTDVLFVIINSDLQTRVKAASNRNRFLEPPPSTNRIILL